MYVILGAQNNRDDGRSGWLDRNQTTTGKVEYHQYYLREWTRRRATAEEVSEQEEGKMDLSWSFACALP